MKKKGKGILTAIFSVLIVALAAVGGLLAFRIMTLKKYEKQISLGAKYLEELDYENAEICFEKAIEIDEKKTEPYLQLSVVYVQQQRYEEAREILQKAEDTASRLPEEVAGQLTEQVETAEKEMTKRQERELFEAYLKESLIPERGLADLGPKEGWMYSHADTWFQPDGILSALIEDLDEDEGLEMLVLSIEDPAAEQYEGRPVDLAYAQSAKNVMGTVYEIADGEVQAADTALIREYNEKDWKIFTFTSPQADRISLFGTLLEVDGKKHLFFERYEAAAAFADGMTQDYWMMCYQDGALQMEASFTQPGFGSSDFQYIGYKLEEGQVVSSEIVCSEAYMEKPGKYGSYEAGVEGFFGELGVQAAFTDHMESILTSENEMSRILDYRTDRTEFSSDFKSAKFKLEGTDYTGLHELAGGETDGGQEEDSADAWKEAYLQYLTSKGGDRYNAAAEYALLYINEDEIPELLIEYGTTAGGGEICTWNESTGTVVSQSLWTYGLGYLEKGNLLCDSGGHMDHYYDTVYQIQDGQFVKVAEGKTDGTITDGTISYTYTWNGETVDEAAYKSSLDGVIDLDQLIRPYSSTVEWDEIIAQIRAK